MSQRNSPATPRTQLPRPLTSAGSGGVGSSSNSSLASINSIPRPTISAPMSRTTSAQNLISSPSASASRRASSMNRIDINDLQKSENVMVSVRVRPLSDSERENGQHTIWEAHQGEKFGRISMDSEWKERLRKNTAITEFFYGKFHSRNVIYYDPTNNNRLVCISL